MNNANNQSVGGVGVGGLPNSNQTAAQQAQARTLDKLRYIKHRALGFQDNLRSFNIYTFFRPDELEAFKEAFDMFDKNQDGTISTKVRKKIFKAASVRVRKFKIKWITTSLYLLWLKRPKHLSIHSLLHGDMLIPCTGDLIQF